MAGEGAVGDYTDVVLFLVIAGALAGRHYAAEFLK